MLESMWWLAEGAAVAGPAVGAAFALRARGRRRRWLTEPILWDGGQPVSLATIFSELNGQANMIGALRELVGGEGPLSGAELERAVRQLQASPASVQQLLLDLGTEVVMRVAPPSGTPTADLGRMERLSEALGRMGFFEFVGYLNLEREGAPPLLPVEGLMVGGLPTLGADDGPGPAAEGGGLLAAVAALRNAGAEGWLPSMARAVEELVKDWRIKKARDQVHRACHAAGTVIEAAARGRSPLWAQLRRNVYQPLDAYRTLEAQAKARHEAARKLRGLVVPSVEAALWAGYRERLAAATRVVEDKCRSLERLLAGQHGPAAAGEVLYRHRRVLLAGVAPDAVPTAGIATAREALAKAMEEAGQAS